ncbi:MULTISPECIES: Rho-binding antiterminator [Methylomonas]|uniref:Rho-binding antiterminator n=1 Tax=Methylomonas TaxID=416 RepID=UPI001232B4F5|nr:Rho-binding antiterminator [Methylomonas rhizoryzae]
MASSPIPCALHDYIEIACLYRYRLKLNLVDGTMLEGIALTTETTPERREMLVLGPAPEQRIELNRVSKLTVLTENARFQELRLS